MLSRIRKYKDVMESEQKKSTLFDTAIETFLNHIESLWSALPNVLKTIEKSNQEATNKYNTFLLTKCKFVPDKGHYLVEPEYKRRNDIFKKATLNSNIAYTIIKRNFVVSLISQFDTYIAALIRNIFILRPDLINNSERQMTFSDLTKFNDINEAREFLVEKEIESVLRENHTEQFKWFEKKLSIQLRKDLPIWTSFIEVTQRRNIFVHNDGKVSNQYLKACNEERVPLPKGLKVGDVLDVDIEYFNNAFKCLFEMGFKLNQVLRRNLLPDELPEADASFLNISFELIQNEQYDLAKELYDFADKYIKRYSTQDFELRILLNRAQIYKWLNQNDTCVEIINSMDWTACSDIFKMGHYILKDDFTNAVISMKAIGNNSMLIGKAEYQDWPIFKEFRKTEQFKMAYKEIYGAELEIIEEQK